MAVTANEILLEIAVEVAGCEIFVERSLETLRAIEEAVGAAAPFGRRLEAGTVQPAEVTALFYKLTCRVRGGPTIQQIEEWVSEVGTAHPRLGIWIASLAFGEERVARAARGDSLPASDLSFEA